MNRPCLPLPVAGLRHVAAWLLIGLSLLMANAYAQETGSVEGRVLNATSGRYLNNVRVSVEGTTQETFTNEFGEYRLVGLPAGEVRLNVVFTGMAPQTVAVTVQAGQVTEKDVTLGLPGAATGTETIELDAFVVASERETNAANIAANEQRFANNIKNVVSADAFGDVTEGNVGEFIKYLPGISVDYVAADVRTISVRGFSDNYTGVSVDGARMASSASGSSTRAFELEQVSINNVSRIEVTKVPTPDSPADSLGGSVNMISKSAFERSGAQLNYRAVVNFNSEDLEFWKKTPGPGDKKTFKVLPGFDFDYTLPVSRNFGIVVTGLSSNQFNEQHRTQMNWQNSGTGTGATPANPYLRQYTVQDGPKNTYRDSLSVKADWRPARNHLISAGVQANYYKSFFGNRNLNINAGTTGTSTPAGGTALTYGPDFTSGASGRGAVTIGSAFRDKLGATTAGNLKYTFNDGRWEVVAGMNGSASRTWYRAGERGHFAGIGVALNRPSRVVFNGLNALGGIRPNEIQVFDNTNTLVDIYDLNNYRLNTATVNPLDARDEFVGGNVSVKRNLDFLAFPASVKIGADLREQTRDIKRVQSSVTYLGADGVAGTADDGVARFLDVEYSREDPYFGLPRIQWPSPFLMWEDYLANPTHWTQTAAQAADAETFRITNSEYLKERVTSYFFQFEARLLENRLGIVTGVRYEKTEDDGLGMLYDPDLAFQRNADGSFVRDQAGNRVRKPEAGAAGSLEEVRITRLERQYAAKKDYDGSYPSFHANYNVTDNLLVRFAYAKTFGRPDFSNIIPNATIDENEAAELDPTVNPGTITVRNTGLKPWTADNYDVSVEYYSTTGGTFSAGVFQKDITDFFGSQTVTATPALLQDLGLDDRYVGWQISTNINAGDAKISGYEINARQSLAIVPFLGDWGRSFTLFANGTKLKLEGQSEANFDRFIPENANWGLDFNRQPWVVKLKWNYRGEQRRGAQTAFGANGREFYTARTNLDVNVEYKLSKRFTFFANARNLLNEPQRLVRYGDLTPDYARFYQDEEFGVQMSVGVKGTW